PTTPVKKQAPIKKAAAKTITTGAENAAWNAGDKAVHKKWGVGTVVKVKGEGADMELDIAFPAPTGIKRLLAKFAPITKQYEVYLDGSGRSAGKDGQVNTRN